MPICATPTDPATGVPTIGRLSTVSARHALREELGQLQDALIDAFAEDPLMQWIFPDGGEARRPWFGVALRAGLRRGHTYRSGDCSGAAIWAPPGIGSFDRTEAAELYQSTRELYGEAGIERLQAAGAATAAAHPSEPHFYLFIIGVAGRSRGVGSSLLSPVLRICDEQSFPAYLESSNPRNVGFYERHGFRGVGEIVPVGGPPLLGMWREPGSR